MMNSFLFVHVTDSMYNFDQYYKFVRLSKTANNVSLIAGAAPKFWTHETDSVIFKRS